MKKLSIVVIAFNEEENIEKCIDSVMEIADEVIVVDSFSTDKTIEIAKSKGAQVILHTFEGHIQQKNFAKTQATGDWTLSLDADETLSKELLQNLKKWKKEEESEIRGYKINRLNFYCGKPIKTCGWYPDSKIRLWARSSGEWKGRNPHDRFELYEGKRLSGWIGGDILHNTYSTHDALLSQVEKFADISAGQLKNENTGFLFLKMIFSPPFKFIRNFFFKFGFTDGTDGLTICYHQSREVFLKYYRAIKLKYQ